MVKLNLTFYAAVVRILLIAFTNMVPTKEASGINPFIPFESLAIS
jgi:hypothetical protein